MKAMKRSYKLKQRADDAGVAAAVGLAGADPVAVFAEVRRRKDNF